MQTIVQRLKREPAARIALCLQIPLDEDPGSTNPFQAAANQRIAEFNAILQDIVAAEDVRYLPLYKRLEAILVASPGGAMTSFRLLPFDGDLFRQVVLRQSNDVIGRRNGWQVHRDGVHLNSRSGRILVDLVQELITPDPVTDSRACRGSDIDLASCALHASMPHVQPALQLMCADYVRRRARAARNTAPVAHCAGQ